MIQPAVINKILNILGICNELKMHDAPANVILIEYEDGNRRKKELQYRSVIDNAYISLSQRMRDFIPFRHILLEV